MELKVEDMTCSALASPLIPKARRRQNSLLVTIQVLPIFVAQRPADAARKGRLSVKNTHNLRILLMPFLHDFIHPSVGRSALPDWTGRRPHRRTSTCERNERASSRNLGKH